MVGWLKFNIIEKIPFMVYLEIQCITFKMEKSFIAHPWIQRSVVGLEEYSAHDWRAATSGTARPSYLARVGPVVFSTSEVLRSETAMTNRSSMCSEYAWDARERMWWVGIVTSGYFIVTRQYFIDAIGWNSYTSIFYSYASIFRLWDWLK